MAVTKYLEIYNGRSREGAWIEIRTIRLVSTALLVAPARERGLKFKQLSPNERTRRRSREGAWIEMLII